MATQHVDGSMTVAEIHEFMDDLEEKFPGLGDINRSELLKAELIGAVNDVLKNPRKARSQTPDKAEADKADADEADAEEADADDADAEEAAIEEEPAADEADADEADAEEADADDAEDASYRKRRPVRRNVVRDLRNDRL